MSVVPVVDVSELLREKHYLGPTKSARFAWADEHGVMVFAAPRSRNLPCDWLELVRWCLIGGPNAGSKQWAAFAAFARTEGLTTTVVSYSDPSQGHTGALYRACGWLWAPTWLRLRPPPTGNGAWTDGRVQAVKDRWVFPLAPDERREGVLAVNDSGLLRRVPWASYTEPEWRKGKPRSGAGGGDYKRFREEGLP